MPTRITAAPYLAGTGQKKTKTWIVPTDQGEFTLRDLSDELGLPYETMRCRISDEKWKREKVLKTGHIQTDKKDREYQPGSYIPKGGRRRAPESIPVGSVERRATYDDFQARRKAFLEKLVGIDAEYRDYLKAHKAMCR